MSASPLHRPDNVPPARLTASLPREPMSAEAQVQALDRLQKVADERVRLGTQLLEAADAKFRAQRETLDAIQAEQRALREQMEAERKAAVTGATMQASDFSRDLPARLDALNQRLEVVELGLLQAIDQIAQLVGQASQEVEHAEHIEQAGLRTSQAKASGASAPLPFGEPMRVVLPSDADAPRTPTLNDLNDVAPPPHAAGYDARKRSFASLLNRVDDPSQRAA